MTVEKKHNIIWTTEERDLIIEAGRRIAREDPLTLARVKRLMDAAQRQALPTDRVRDLHSVAPNQISWFITALHVPADASAPAPTSNLPIPVPDASEAIPAPSPLLYARLANMDARLKEIELSVAKLTIIMYAVADALDPSLTAALDVEPAAPPIAIEPSPMPPVTAAPTPAPAPPKPRIAVLGIRPDTEASVRSRLRDLPVSLTCLTDDRLSLVHDYRNYFGVVVTRHTTHQSFDKAKSDVGADRLIRLRATGVDGIADAVRELVAKATTEKTDALVPGRSKPDHQSRYDHQPRMG